MVCRSSALLHYASTVLKRQVGLTNSRASDERIQWRALEHAVDGRIPKVSLHHLLYDLVRLMCVLPVFITLQ